MPQTALTALRDMTRTDVIRLVALVALSCLAVFLSHEFTRAAGRVASIWPLNALLVAAIVRWRAIDWRVILAAGAGANIAVDLAMGDTLLNALMLTGANVAEIAVIVVCLRLEKDPIDLTRGDHLLRFFVVAGVLAPAVSSVVAAITLSPQQAFTQTLGVWFAADALGMLIFTPAFLALWAASDEMWSRRRLAEMALSLFGVGIIAVLVFSQDRYPLLFLIPPALTFAVFRLGAAGAAANVLLVAVLAIGFAMAGHGPIQLIQGSETERILVLQGFLAILSLTQLPLAAALAHGARARERLRGAIAEAETARAAAERSEAQYRKLADHSTDIVVRFGPGGVITYASPACRLLGISPEDAIGRSTIEFAAPEHRAEAARLVDALFAGPEPDRRERRQFLARRADGADIWLEGNPSIIRNARGEPVEVVTIYRDVTAHRRLEDDLNAARARAERAAAAAAESEARYRTITEISLDIIARVGIDTKIRYASPGAELVLGYTPEELVGTRTIDHMHPEDLPKVLEFYEDLLAAGPGAQLRPFEYRARHKDGHYIWIEGMPRVLFDDAGKPIEIQDAARDITARKKLQDDLAAARFSAEAAARAKADFLANMSHEIRTPLNSIIGYARLLEQGLGPDTEERRYAELVSRSGGSLLAIVNDVLDLSAIDAGGLRLDSAPFSPRRAVEQVADELALAAQSKGLKVALDFDADSAKPVCGDEGRLRQVLTNLFSNAIKFTERGGVNVTLTSIPVEPAKRRLRIVVRDTGAGIPSQFIPSLFERFTQADASITRHAGGTGLGLAISKSLVELMGGRIGVESAEGVGSTFWFEIDAPAAEPVSAPATRSVEEARAKRILVVDDVEENRDLLALMLAGHEIDRASSGAEAIELAGARRYDLVLMDVRMPNMDGMAATRAIREEPSGAQLPIVAVSAHVLPEQIAAFKAAGMSDYLAKPIDPEALQAIVRKWTGEAAQSTLATQSALEALRIKFVARCLADHEALERLRLPEDVREIRAIVHRLAGSAATFGFPDAGLAALAVDQALSSGSAPKPEDVEMVLAALKRICAGAEAA
jgi:PAS domain S-box-containing protein